MDHSCPAPPTCSYEDEQTVSSSYLHSLFVHRQAVALVYEHGEGGPTRAVCVDKGLDFTIGEMSSGDLGPLTDNRLFRGGEVCMTAFLTGMLFMCTGFGRRRRR